MTAPRATVTAVPYAPPVLPGQIVTVAAALTRRGGAPAVPPGTPLIALRESTRRAAARRGRCERAGRASAGQPRVDLRTALCCRALAARPRSPEAVRRGKPQVRPWQESVR